MLFVDFEDCDSAIKMLSDEIAAFIEIFNTIKTAEGYVNNVKMEKEVKILK